MNLINDHIKLKKSVRHIKILLVALALSTAISIGTLSYVLYQQQGVIDVWNMIMNDIGEMINPSTPVKGTLNEV